MMRPYVLFIAIFLCSPAYAATNTITYDVRIKGVEEKTILNALTSASDSVKLKDKPPESLILLDNRVQGDKKRFDGVLSDRGYYAAQVEASVNERVSPVMVTFNITLNQPFIFHEFILEGVDRKSPDLRVPTFTELGLVKGEVSEADEILEAQRRLLQSFYNQGYPFAVVEEPSVIVDHLTHHVTVTYRVNTGKLMVFGDTSIIGLESVKDDYIRKKIPWQKGDRYDPKLITQLDKELTDTNLFTLATIDKKQEGDSNRLAMTLNMKERLHRTIKAGLNYTTDEGPGVLFSWEHRNLLHRNENFIVSNKIASINQTGGIVYRKPDYRRLNQTLRLGFEAIGEQTDAYDSKEITSSAGIERKITDRISAGLGGAYTISEVEQLGNTDNFGLLSLPSFAAYDTRDNLYDPSKGTNLNAAITPFIDTLGAKANFLRLSLSGTHYWMLREDPSLLLAGRAAFGSIQGASTGDVPPNQRFYAGGSGSVRGYGYKTLSPTLQGVPVGGSSLLELSAELRARVSEKLGIVGFIDGGNSFENAVPDNGELRYGVGAGIRYYTLIAPIRFDIAIPLNKLKGESAFQIYFSLGQAF